MAEISKENRSTARPCPICGKPASVEDRPFCSRRCADVDLHRWLKGSYAIPAAPSAEDDEDLPGGEPKPEG
ncbi:MAG: DNA gyrase inhibitor YacG [Beijerinckiaceae bacterium]|nr:MAG: DNA gyrase inhibitor YacG [Beijerinckiaceae bacterium]